MPQSYHSMTLKKSTIFFGESDKIITINIDIMAKIEKVKKTNMPENAVNSVGKFGQRMKKGKRNRQK